MKKKIIILAAIIFTVILTSAIAFAINMQPQYNKPSDYHVGVKYEDALKSDKPMVALFYVDWCGYCMKFMPKFKIVSDIYKNKFNFVMLNAEDTANKKLVEDVALTGFPTVYILDPKYDNRVLLNGAIYQDLKKLRIELDRYIRIRGILDSAKK